MKRFFTLEYRQDDDKFVGKLKEIPGVFSQGKTIEELKENIIDAYRMMLQEYDVIFNYCYLINFSAPLVLISL